MCAIIDLQYNKEGYYPMATTTKLNRIASLIIALVMIFSIIPFQSFAAAPVAAADLQLKDGVTVAISQDMTDDQVKKALFEQLVADAKGANYQDYEWEIYAKSYSDKILGEPMARWNWGDALKGFSWNEKIALTWHGYHVDPFKMLNDGEYQIRLKGTEAAVKVKKVSTANVSYNWDSFMGTVKVNDKTAANTNGVNPSKEITMNVIPNEGYKISSVKMNGAELTGSNGVYKFLPVANTKIEVSFAEDGVFHNISLKIGKGITVKVNGIEFKDSVRVKEGVDYTFVVTPDASTSVKAIAVNGEDITSTVNFAKYVGTFTKNFTQDDTIEFVTVDVKNTIVLNNKLEVGYAVAADGQPDFTAIRENFIKGVIDSEKSALKFTPANTDFQEWKQLRLAGGGYGAWSWVKLEGEKKELGTYFEASKPGNNLKFHVRFLGNEQFRPTEYIEFHADVKDVRKADIALKSNPTVEIVETAVGVYDYTNLNEKVFAAAIDAEKSFPANITLKDIVLTVPQNITNSGSYKVKASIAGTTSYYAASVEFNVQFNIVKRPTADIALKADKVNVTLDETNVGVYDNAKMKADAKAAALDLAACKANGLDVSLITLDMEDVKADGIYTATIKYPTTDMIYGAQKNVNVVVKVNKCPTVKFEAKDNQSATLFKNYDGTYDYAELKSQIFNLITVSGVEGIKAENCKFLYETGTLAIKGWYEFDVDNVGADTDHVLYDYLRDGGNFKIQVTLPNSDTYYGTAIEFSVNVVVKDNHTADVVLNEGAPYKVVLNKNKNGTYNYDALKAEIFAVAVKEIKNVPGTTKYTDVNFQYKPWGAKEFHNFEEDVINGDASHIIYTRLCDSKKQDFDVTLNVPGGLDYHGTTVTFKINVEVKDPHKANIAINGKIAPVTLTETTVGTFDMESFKRDVFAAAINAAASTPSTLKFEDFIVEVPNITKSGDYTVNFKYNGDFNYNAESVSVLVHVDVKYLPTAKIVLKTNAVSVNLNEIEAGRYDFDALKKEIFEKAVDTEKSFPVLTADDITVTFDREITKSGKYTATIKFASTDKVHGAKADITADVTLVLLPKVELAFKNADLTLNKLQNGNWGYDDLKKAIFDNCLNVTGVEGLTYDKFDFEYKPWGLNMGWTAFETEKVTFAERYLRQGGEFDFRVSIPTSSTYHGTEIVFKLTIKTADPYKQNIVLKNDYQKVFELGYDSLGNYNYAKLQEEIFNALVDTTKSPAHMNYANAIIEYKPHTRGVDGATIDAAGFHPLNLNVLNEDAGGTFLYLRHGGVFTFRIAFAATDDCRAAEVVFKLTVNPEKRAFSAIVLKDVDREYDPSVEVMEQSAYDAIDFAASKLPADVKRENFVIEYKAPCYTWGGSDGNQSQIIYKWVPFTGENVGAGIVYRQIEVGNFELRVRFTGNETYLPCTSNIAHINVRHNTLTINVNSNSKFIDEKIPANMLTFSTQDNFNEYYIFTSIDSNDTAIINVDDKDGMVKNDFTAYIPFNQLLLDVLGIDAILSAEEVYTNRGLTREQLITLLSDSRFVKFVSERHDIDAAACAKLLEAAKSLPENIKHVRFHMGQPEYGGKYQFIVMAGNANYKTAFTCVEPFYVKFHSRGAKLQWIQDIGRLNAITAKWFNFNAILTRDGIPVDSSHVKYIYTGFRANCLFYGSTKNPPRQPGIYTQTAFTGIKGKYAFPKTRTFVIHVL